MAHAGEDVAVLHQGTEMFIGAEQQSYRWWTVCPAASTST
jgi:hypothetical protein